MAESEVARLTKQIADEYQAAQNALTGLALGTARHAFITARMEHIEGCRQKINRLVGEQEGIRLVAETLEKC
jgi:hypothetical protein